MSLIDNVINTTASFGALRMDFTMILSIIIAIISLIVLFWLTFLFETNYVTIKANIISDPECKTDDKNITTGNINVKFRYNNSDYTEKVNVNQACYNYTKNSSVKVRFDPNNIGSTIFVASNDPKFTLIIITSIFLILSLLTFFYNYILKNNKVAQTISGAQGVTQGIRSLI